MNIHLVYPWLLLVLPWVVVVWHLLEQRREGRGPAVPWSGKLVREPLERRFLEKLAPHFRLLSVALVVFAMAQPQQIDLQTESYTEGVDILFVVDVSHSMTIKDMGAHTSRLKAAKETLREFILGRPHDRLGLVVFSGESYTMVPLTTDTLSVLDSVHQIKVDMRLKQGTALGQALAHSVARLRASSSQSRVVVLLTDGQNNAGLVSPNLAIRMAENEGVKVYSLAVGVDGPTTIPKDGKEMPFISTVDDELLRTIASATKGMFFRVNDQMDLSKAFSKINQMEKNRFLNHTEVRFFSWYPILLWLAFFLWVAAFLIQHVWFRRAP